MCLIIANPQCAPVPKDHIVNAFATNHDGFGIMWADPKSGHLKVIRGMFGVELIESLFARMTKNSTPYVAHFRFATHGTKNSDNCHPFAVSGQALGGIGMVHNGTLSGGEWRAPKKSDTALLADMISEDLRSSKYEPEHLFEIEAPPVVSRYGRSIGSDKLVFMNGLGEINIVNSKNGTWKEQVWYSNTYSIMRSAYSFGGMGGMGGYDWGDDEEALAEYGRWFT